MDLNELEVKCTKCSNGYTDISITPKGYDYKITKDGMYGIMCNQCWGRGYLLTDKGRELVDFTRRYSRW